MPPIRRTTARKSAIPVPVLARECLASNSQHGGEFPANSDDVSSLDSELERAICDLRTKASPSPARVSSSAVLSDSAGESPERRETDCEARAEEEVVVLQDDAGVVPSSEFRAEMEMPVNEGEVGSRLVGTEEDNVIVDDKGGKRKTAVKKTVKVVKKVIRKVLKKVPKVKIDAKLGNVAEISNPNPTVSCVVETEEVKQNSLMEVDDNGGGPWLVTGNEVVLEHWAEAMDVEEERCWECERENDELNGIGRWEDEEGEWKLSGQFEEIECRKWRQTEIIVVGLDKDMKEDDIRKIFAEVGEIMDVTMVMNGRIGKNEGYAFVQYATAEEAKRALEKFSRVKICGRQCGATASDVNNTIFLGNINKKWKDEDVLKLLQGIGIEHIDKVIVLVDPSNSDFNRGIALIDLETRKDAQIAYKKLTKGDAFGRNRSIKVAWAKTLRELNKEEKLKVNLKVSLVKATMSKSETPKAAAKPIVKEVPQNKHEMSQNLVRRSLPPHMIGDVSWEEEIVRQFKECKPKGASEAFDEVAKMKVPHKPHETLNACTTPPHASTPYTPVGSKDGSRTDEPFGDKSPSVGSSGGKKRAKYSLLPPPPKRNRCFPSGSSSAAVQVMQASVVEAPLLALAPVCLVPSATALKARVASLEKQRFDALKRALKAEEAKSKAEKSEEASMKKLQVKKNKIKALKNEHKDEIKNLKRKYKASLKKAEDRSFKNGREYQLDLVKEALAFFDAEFRFLDFAPSLDYIEQERQKSLEAAAQQVCLEAEQSASRSKGTVLQGSPTNSSAFPIHDKAIGKEEGLLEEQEEQDEKQEEELGDE